MLLADELVQRTGAHPVGQRRTLLGIAGKEVIHDVLPPLIIQNGTSLPSINQAPVKGKLPRAQARRYNRPQRGLV